MTWNRILFIVATVLFAVLLVVSLVGTVDAAAKDALLFGGLTAFAGGHI